MRTSLVKGLVVIACVAVMGSGCKTLHRWWYGPDKTPTGTPTTETLPPTEAFSNELSQTGTGDLPQVGEDFTKRPIDADAHFAPVHFSYDSFVVPPQEMPKIQQIGQYLLDNSSRVCIIDGHCDERGSREYNVSLGDQRAQAVRTCLVGLGIDAARLQTRSFGKEKPANPGHNEAAWAENRRGEFEVHK